VTDGRGGLRLRKALISLEVGLSAALLIVAVLLTSSLSRLLNVDKGFEVDRILTLDVELSGNRYAEAVRRGQMFDRVLANVGAIPGVVAAGAITQLPALGQTWNDPIYLENAPRDQWHAVDNRYASPGYFRTMKIGVRSGRFFEERDRGHAVAVLSEKAARLLWPGDLDPVGRTFMGEDDKLKTLVGVVSEVRATLHEQAPPTAYYPYWQREPFEMSLVVRTAGDPSAVGGFVRAALRDQDSLLAIPPVQAMQDLVDRSVAERRFLRSVMLTFAASAFLVAALGIYGIVSYSVARRRNEIGIRMALGAGRPRLFALVLREGMTPVVIGLAAGAAAAPVLGQGIRALLFDVRPGDPATIAGVVLAMIAVAVLACVVPARRVTGPNAVAALRSE
jgi:putative ABC transport system permease protein